MAALRPGGVGRLCELLWDLLVSLYIGENATQALDDKQIYHFTLYLDFFLISQYISYL